MPRKRKNKHGVPRRKRMKRPDRLRAAVAWLEQFEGKNVLRGYCKWFGVNWNCAAVELPQLGVKLDPDYLKQLEATDRSKAKRKALRKREQEESLRQSWYDSDVFLGDELVREYCRSIGYDLREDAFTEDLDCPDEFEFQYDSCEGLFDDSVTGDNGFSELPF